MGKKVNRAIVLMMAISLLLGSVTAYAAENQEPAIEEVELQAQNASSGRELVDVIYFQVSGEEVTFSDEPIDSSVTTYQSDNVITGSINYYYDGMDSQNRPGYTVEATMISSNLNISSSNLMTKAEGVSDWHENEVNHYTGKVAVNTRSYIYNKQKSRRYRFPYRRLLTNIVFNLFPEYFQGLPPTTSRKSRP